MRATRVVRIAEYWIDDELPARASELAYRASHRMLPRCARVVVLKPELVGDREAERRLLREACVLELLHHGGAPRVFDCGIHDRLPWIATEYIEGVSIEQLAAEHPVAIGDALAIVRDAAAILAHAHDRGVVHRNLTPTSIVRTPSRSFPVCILGWDHAAVDRDGQDRPVAGAGTGRDAPAATHAGSRFTCAPELLGEGPAGPPADVFALGAIMFEASTLVLPEPVQRFPGLPEPFHQLLASMLARDPDDRPTAAAVQVEASRLVELFAEGEAAIEEVEVELVDIASTALSLPNLGWIPPEQAKHVAIGSLRRRREP